VLERVPAARIGFDELIYDREELAAVLAQLYPDVELRKVPPATGAEIAASRRRREELRHSPHYSAVHALVKSARKALA
jgi:hypothetical protein